MKGNKMKNYNIIYKKNGKYSAIVYAVSYVNPIDDIQLISNELKEHLPDGGYILFDLLLSNGDNFNRFAEVFFDGNNISGKSISIIELPSEVIAQLNMYYNGKIKELSQSVLSQTEQYKFATK